MKYFLDTEFMERPCTIELISIGIVAEDGRQYYAVNTEADCKLANRWVIDNVLKKIPEYNHVYNDLRSQGGQYKAKSKRDIAKEILEFCGYNNNVREIPEFWGYYCSYDWVAFCWCFGAMVNLPEGWSKRINDVKQLCDMIGNPDLPFMPPDLAHNALNDALWIKECYYFIKGQMNIKESKMFDGT